METSYLDTFVLVVESGSMSEAARRLEITPAAVAHQLRLLEREGLIYRHYEATVPPQVTYGLTDRGLELVQVLDQLGDLALRWYGDAAIAPANPGPQTSDVAVDSL